MSLLARVIYELVDRSFTHEPSKCFGSKSFVFRASEQSSSSFLSRGIRLLKAGLQREVSGYLNFSLIIGRVGERRATSLKPARTNAFGMPVQAKAGGISFSDLGSTG